MLLALLLLAALPDWVPARWNSADPATLGLLAETPVNCLLLGEPHWSAEFARQAASREIATLGVVSPGSGAADAARRALARKLTGVFLEGDFDAAAAQSIRELVRESKAVLVELPSRSGLNLREAAPVSGTFQGIWPGIHVLDDGAAKAAPTGGPWIDTNGGLLRFLRAASGAPVWIGFQPPPKNIIPPERYLAAICDAAIAGARWIVSLDADLEKRLLAGDPAAVRTWRRMGAYLKYFEDHRDWRGWGPCGGLAMVQDADSGAVLSGSILDMVVVKNTPLRSVPRWKLSAETLRGSKMAVSVDPESLTPGEKDVLRGFARSGGTLISGPPGWKFAPPSKGQLALGKDDLEKLDQIWKGVNSLVGRGNLGARLFNVSSMLSNLLASPDGKQVALHLVNFSGYPVESVTAQLLGSYKRARLLTPEAPPRDLEVYEVEEGTGVDIPEVAVFATLILN